MENINSNEKTSIPLESADADNLPREKAFTYNEIALVVGNLYLESQHRSNILNEQFQAVSEEYQKQLMEAKQENQRLNRRVNELEDELRKRNES